MSMIEAIRKDREAGTPGTWIEFKDTYSGSYEVRKAGPEKNPFRQSVLLARVYQPTTLPKNHPDSRRIARVPDMEAALLAAEELAKFLERIKDPRVVAQPRELNAALAAYRAATEGKA